MKNKGQVAIFTIMLAVVVILLAIAFAPVIKEFVDDARNETNDNTIGLNCTSDLISDYDRATCVVADSFNWYFFGFLIAFAGSIIGARILFGG